MDLKNYTPLKKFSHKHFLTLMDYDTDDILQVLKTAVILKEKQKAGIPHELLKNKKMAMVFSKMSLRTNVSFGVGIYELGGMSIYLDDKGIGLGTRETVKDIARVLSHMCDLIMIRTYAQKDVEELAATGSVPVINGLTDMYHPCQALADILTVYEQKNKLAGLKLAFIGDGNNVAHSLMIICSKLGMNITIGCPKGFEPDADITSETQKIAKQNGCCVEIVNDPNAAVKDSDVVYTDVWASMGQEDQAEEKKKNFLPFQVNEELFSKANNDAIFLHCLPAHRGEEVTDNVIESDSSYVFDEAENRVHAQKAVMTLVMGQEV